MYMFYKCWTRTYKNLALHLDTHPLKQNNARLLWYKEEVKLEAAALKQIEC